MDPERLLEFARFLESLKRELRHSWLSDDRQESTAEHTWRMALMAVLLKDEIDDDVDLPKTLKMVLVHDLAEGIVGDIPAWHHDRESHRVKEQDAMKRLREQYPELEELFDLWDEYTEGQTAEAQFAKALDKLEGMLQHNQSSLERWNSEEFKLHMTYAERSAYDPYLARIYELLKKEAREKIDAFRGPTQ